MKDCKILIVEDEPEVLGYIQGLLTKSLGCTTEAANGGREAVGKINAADYDLVILDINMPAVSGLDVMREVKKTKELPDILVVTGHDNELTLNAALDEGAIDYLTKPLDAKILIEKVRELLDWE
jgi:DNA-binding response OmpR family regulator